MNTPPKLSIGTKVVTQTEMRGPDDGLLRPAGMTGMIVRAPGEKEKTYRVRFPDGMEVSLEREAFAILKHFLREGLEADWEAQDLQSAIIYRCVVGSRAYGLDDERSDTDLRGIYLPFASMHWSLYGVPEQLEDNETQECYWELQKFLLLALKANPNVLECLYTPLVLEAHPLTQELLELRSIFLSKLIYQTYNRYVLSQFHKLEHDLKTKGALKWKHAMHLTRLLLSGITILKEGFVPVQVGEHRETLLSIRRGERSWEQVNAWRLELHQKFDEAFAQTKLPDRPDFTRANQFLIKARRYRADEGK